MSSPAATELAAPAAGLPFPRLDLAWTPPMATAGDASALAAALARFPEVELQLGPRLAGAAWQQRGAALVAALSPDTRVAAVARGSLAGVLAADPALARPVRTLGPNGRPRYAAPGLQPTWPEGQAMPRLVVDDATVEASAWQALPAVSVGSCEPAMQALAEGQELALVQLTPFLDRVDARLAASHRARLQARLPAMQAALAAVRTSAEPACAEALRMHLRAHEDCLAAATCAAAPRIVLAGGATIVAPEVEPPIPAHCAAQERDVPAQLRRISRDAVAAAIPTLDPGWSTLADRLGALSEVHAALEDICTPRRRRFAAADIAEARRRLASIGVALASDERRGGRWQLADEAATVAGLGAVRVQARFAAGPASVNAGIVAEARALRDFVIARSMCRSGHAAAPLAVLLRAPGAREPAFFGYFLEEELFCGALPPLGVEP
ncbi:MAG TPA: hypothetical protein VGB85_16750 [Nannocystis sp.]